jgi:SagB-type dehydrogenase family enzyme
MTPHYLDWADVPRRCKTYPLPAAAHLIPVEEVPDTSLWRLVEKPQAGSEKTAMDVRLLSQVLMSAYGFTAKQKMGGQNYRYRSVPSAGALYPAEIYLAWPGLFDLQQGLYYYDINGFSLVRLRSADLSSILRQAMPLEASAAQLVSFLLSGIFFRSAWKYRQRAFRYVLLDIGHLIENLSLSLKLFGISSSVHYDFDDASLGRLAGLDGKREACFACVNVRLDSTAPPPDTTMPAGGLPPLPETVQQASRAAVRETRYKEIEAIYRISSQHVVPAVKTPADLQVMDQDPNEWFPILKTDKRPDSKPPFAEIVRQRRSKRNFIAAPFPAKGFMKLLDLLCAFPAEGTGEGAGAGAYLKIGFLAGNVEGLDPGFYMLSRTRRAYGLVAPGMLTEKMASVCLDQAWLKFASLHFLFMANLRALDTNRGPRGYRHVMMDAGRLGQRLYLGATALGAGCCGIGALYDDEARNLLSLNADSALLYLVAVGPIIEK